MDDERRVYFLCPCDTKTLSVFKNKRGFKMKQRSFLCALAGVLGVFWSATLGAAQDVTHSRGQVLFHASNRRRAIRLAVDWWIPKCRAISVRVYAPVR